MRGAAATIAFTLPANATDVDLSVFDVSGRRVATLARGAVEAGPHTVRWDGGTAAGIYFVRLTALGTTRVAKLAKLP